MSSITSIPANVVGGSSIVNVTPWSTLGIVADDSTDNTDALNALPTGRIIYGDTGPNNIVRFATASNPWLWQSNLILDLRQCPMVSYLTVKGSITQQDVGTTPISNVFVTGLKIGKPNNVDYDGTLINVWIDHFSFFNFHFHDHQGGITVRGSDVEIAYGLSDNSNPNEGVNGIRIVGNIPKVSTTGGKPANVWVHHNYIEAGDIPYSVRSDAGTQAAATWVNVSADDILFEDSTGIAIFGGITIGVACPGPPTGCLFDAVTVSNVTMRRMTLAGHAIQILLANEENPGGLVSNITFDDIDIDASAETSGAAALAFGAALTAADQADNAGYLIENVTVNNVRLSNVYAHSLTVGPNLVDATFTDCVFPAPATSPTQPYNVRLYGTTRTTITNCQIGANGLAVWVGSHGHTNTVEFPATDPVISGNTITGVISGRQGILLSSVDGATVSNNTISGDAGSIGIEMTVNGTTSGGVPMDGTTNSTLTDNDVSGTTTGLVCAPGQGNVVTGTVGATDCSSDPLYSFDFTVDGTLPWDSTDTRADTGWYFDSAGTLQSAAADTARWTYDRNTLALRGMLNEPARTNQVPNNDGTGVTDGSPGTAPTGWTITSAPAGVTRTISHSTEDGITKICVRYNGTTPGSSGSLSIRPETTTDIAASQGQTWAAAVFCKLEAGTTTGFTFQQRIQEYDGGGSPNGSSNSSFTPTSAALRTQRNDMTRTLTGVGTANVTSAVIMNYAASTAIDITICVGLAQLDQTDDIGSPIVTSSGAVTRGADAVTVPMQDGTYDIAITRQSGVTNLTSEVVTGGAFTVPPDVSPLQTVTANLSA